MLATKAVFTEPMLLLPVRELPEGANWAYELKLDGYRVLAIKTDGKVYLRSRNNKDFNAKYPAIVADLLERLFPVVPRRGQRPAGHRLPSGLDATPDHSAAVGLGSAAGPSQSARLQFPPEPEGWIEWEYLPAYAPELNPVEYIWAYWKQHEVPNVCPRDFWHLSEDARRTLRRMRRRPRLITAFWKQTSLWSE